MKYKHHTLLPIGAFNSRGSVVGGRSLRLHGGDGWWTQEEEPQDGQWHSSGDSYQIWVPNPVEDPITQPAPPPPPPPAPTPPPLAAPAAPAAPAYTPFNLDEFGYTTDLERNYYNDAKLANWHMSRGDPSGYAQQFIDSAKAGREQLLQPFRIDTSTSGGGDAGSNTETFLITPSGQYSVSQDESGKYVANIAGSGGGESDGTQGYTGAAIDINSLAEQEKKALEKQFGTGFGQAVGYAYELKNSEGDPFQRYDAQGNLTEYLDQHGQWQKASDVKPTGTRLNPETGQLDTVYSYGDRGDITGEWVPGMSVYHEDQGGWLGEGGWSRVAGLVAAGLSAGVAGGAFSGIGLGAAPVTGTMGALSAAIPAVNPILTAAVQGALIGTATSGLQGAAPADMLKSAVIGGISAGMTPVIAGADLGTIGNIAARTGVQTGLTAISGGDVGQAAISGIINSVLPVALTEILPADTMSAFNELPDSVKKVVMSTAGSVLNAGFNGQDISDAATSGVINGMISLGKDFVSGAFNDLKESDLAQTVKDYFTPSSTAGDFTGEYETLATESFSQPDIVNEIFKQDADDAFNRNVPPPLVQDTINRNTPITAETVTTPPLIQTAMGQTNPDDVYNQLVSSFDNPYVGTQLASYAQSTSPTSDVGMVTLPTTTVYANDSTAGGFLGDYGDLVPAQSKLTTFGQGMASALDNTVGAILPTVAQMASYLGLRTYDQVAELTSSLIGKEYQANPELMREISNRVAESISNPFGKAFGVTDTSGYKEEASGKVLRFINENLDKGADYLSEKTGLPAGDIRLITDAMMIKPGTTLSTIREAGTAAKDVGRGYVDAATGIIDESPSGAYNLGATVADLTKAPDTSLYRGESNVRPINLGEIIDERTPFVSPEKLTGPTRALEYSSPDNVVTSPEAITPSRDVANLFDQAFTEIDRTPASDVAPLSRVEPVQVATQLAAESKGALPTTFVEPTIKQIDLGVNLDNYSLAKINTEASIVDRNLNNINSPEVQAQTKSFVRNTYETITQESPSEFAVNFYNDLYFDGATSADVATAIADTAKNKAAEPDIIIDQVQEATTDLEEDKKLDTKLNIINNASSLGVTPYEAINLGLLNSDGSKTDLGVIVSSSTAGQTDSGIYPAFPNVVSNAVAYDSSNVDTSGTSTTPSLKAIIPDSTGTTLTNVAQITPTLTTEEEEKKTPQPSRSSGGNRLIINPQFPGALPGILEGTYLKGVEVDDYDPFKNYNVYQQMEPVRAAQGGSPLELMQMQQGIVGGDPSSYSNVQFRPTPDYFTYGSKAQQPTTFAGSQLMGKPRPSIPVTPTGNIGTSDWLYGTAGANQLSPAGASLAALPSGMMANGGMAQGGGSDEHIPEFITGATGHYVRGRGDGQSDDIPAMLADGEYVFDSSAVSTLGNGSSDAGAKLLDAFRETLREHTRSAPKDKIPPKASPLQYMQEAMKKVGMK